MLGLGIGLHKNNFVGGSGSIYDATYQAVLNYATTQGYTLPSDAQKLKQNQLLIDLKSAGVWSKLDTFANFATDGSSEFALIDWKRLTQYTAVNSPAFTINKGFKGVGVGSYVNSNFNPSTFGTNYTLNNASCYVYIETLDIGALSGSSGGDNRMVQGSSATNNRINGGTLSSSFTFMGNGMKSMHRTTSTNVALYNNTTVGTRTATSIVLPITAFVLRYQTNYGSSRASMFAMGASMITENTDFVNAYNTYLNSL